MTSISNLPQELVGKIVDELRGDAPSLRTCALISPVFLPWTRQHLFSSVRLTARNLFAFRALVTSSPAAASYIRRLDILMETNHPPSTLSPETFAQLPHVTHLVAHSDPFGFWHLSPAEERALAGAAQRLTTVHLLIDRLWALPLWATLLDGCPALSALGVHAESNGWSDAEVAIAMPPATKTETTPHLNTLRVSGDVKILIPLAAWLLPRRALDALQKLTLDVLYLRDDYDTLDRDSRPPLVRAAAASLHELTLHLDPPMPLLLQADVGAPLTLSAFPRLRALHLRDGPDSQISASLAWLAAFLNTNATPTSPSAEGVRAVGLDSSNTDSALEEITLNHGMLRRDLLATGVPAATWRALEDALLGAANADSLHRRAPYPCLRTLTFRGYLKYTSSLVVAEVAEAHTHFERTIRALLPRLVERGMLRVAR